MGVLPACSESALNNCAVDGWVEGWMGGWVDGWIDE